MAYEERPDSYYIPDNLNNGRKFFGIRNRNLIETGVAELFLFLVLSNIPFVPAVRYTLMVIVMLVVGIIGIIGIHHESVIEYIISLANFKRSAAVLHLRKVGQPDYTADIDEGLKENGFEKINREIKERIEERVNRGRNEKYEKDIEKLGETEKKKHNSAKDEFLY